MTKTFGYIFLAALVGIIVFYDSGKTANRYKDRVPDKVTMSDIISGKAKRGDWVAVTGYQTERYEVDYTVVTQDKDRKEKDAKGYRYLLLLSSDDPTVGVWNSMSKLGAELKKIDPQKVEGFGSGEGLRLNKLVEKFNTEAKKYKPQTYIALSNFTGKRYVSPIELPDTGVMNPDTEVVKDATPAAQPEDREAFLARLETMSLDDLQREIDKRKQENRKQAEEELAKLDKTLGVARLSKVEITGIVAEVPEGVQGKFSAMIEKSPTREIKVGEEPNWEFLKYMKVCIGLAVFSLLGGIISAVREG